MEARKRGEKGDQLCRGEGRAVRRAEKKKGMILCNSWPLPLIFAVPTPGSPHYNST